MASNENAGFRFGEFLSVGDVAEYLGVSERTVRWWAATGRLRANRVRLKVWFFILSDVEAFSERLGFRPSSVVQLRAGR